MLGTNIYTLTILKIDLSHHPFIKYDIIEVNVIFPLRGTPIDIVTQYCEHHKMSYILQSENNSLWNHAFSAINSNNVWILSIGRKETTIIQQFLESISS